MSFKEHAEIEFKAAGWLDENGKFKDEMQKLMCTQVLELLEKFSEHGHSGFSAPYAINMFKTLASYEPLVPVTGEDWEWVEVSDGVFQNKRCSHVFKDALRFDGQPYDTEAVIYYDWYADPETGEKSKSHFTSSESSRVITFPYTPSREYVERVVERIME